MKHFSDVLYFYVEPIFLASEFFLRLLNDVQQLIDCSSNNDLSKLQKNF